MVIKLPLAKNQDTATVSELIKALQQMPLNATIQTEGCDCYGDACFVRLNANGSVDILRNEPYERKESKFKPLTELTDDNVDNVIVIDEPKKLSDLE